MPVEVRVPEMGESITEATIARWMKREGDHVQAGEAIVELETEKVNTEVPAQQGGVLTQLMKRQGETVGISEVLAVIEEAAPEDEPPAGAQVRGQEPAERPAPDERPDERAEEVTEKEAMPSARQGREEGGDFHAEASATPVARNIAVEHGVDVTSVEGTGPGGRVTKEDVLAYLKGGSTRRADSKSRGREASPPAHEAPAREETPTPAEKPAFAEPPASLGGRGLDERQDYEERVRLSRRRQTIARRLVEAQQEAVPTTTYNEIDLGAVVHLRQQHRETFRERHKVDLGLMSFFVKASVTALREFPYLNSELQGEELVLKYYYHIGIAVASDEGLVVPVLRDADRLSFAEIEEGIQDMVERTGKRRLTLEDLQDGTFTITNGGVFGSLWSSPVLNPPQAGILAMHRIVDRPVVRDGQLVARPMMYVALTYDHRIVDGDVAVRFLVRIRHLIEEPAMLLLET